jgi:hypothetical protein
LPSKDALPGEVEPRGLEALGKQLENAAEALRAVAADGSALVALWSRFIQAGGPSADPPSTPPAPLVATDRLRVRADGNVYVQTAEKGTRLSLGVGTRPRVELTGDAMRFVQRALVARKFEAGDCLGWGDGETKLEWGHVEKLLTNLLDEGFLERATK